MTSGNGDRLNLLVELIAQMDIRMQAQLQQHEERMRANEERTRQHEENMRAHEERMLQNEQRMQRYENRIQNHEERIALLEGIQADLRRILERLSG